MRPIEQVISIHIASNLHFTLRLPGRLRQTISSSPTFPLRPLRQTVVVKSSITGLLTLGLRGREVDHLKGFPQMRKVVLLVNVERKCWHRTVGLSSA